MPEENFII